MKKEKQISLKEIKEKQKRIKEQLIWINRTDERSFKTAR